jgi:hypothetical protein
MQSKRSALSLRSGDSLHHPHCYITSGHCGFLGLLLPLNAALPLIQHQHQIIQTILFMPLNKTTTKRMHLVPPLGHLLRCQHWCHAPQLRPCVQAVSNRPHPRNLSLRTLPPQTYPHLPHSSLSCCHFQGCLRHQVTYPNAPQLPIGHGHAWHPPSLAPL